ncbi:MAG: hypothetical protein K0S34_74 [Bacillales bacterium]|nr:hypothetical protein [Bacillales bacterium]
MFRLKKESYSIKEFLNKENKSTKPINLNMIIPSILISHDLPLGGPFVTVGLVSIGLVILATIDKSLEDRGYETGLITKTLILSSFVGVVYYTVKNYSTYMILFMGG